MKIGFIGVGNLGLPVALSINDKGHEVKVFDLSDRPKQFLDKREIPYIEEGANELLKKHTIQFTSTEDVIRSSEIIFVPVQTPHDPKYDGSSRIGDERKDFDYSFLIQALKDISKITDEIKKEKIVVIISTVLPGTIEREIKPILSKYIKLSYNPFFIAVQTTIKDFTDPEFVLLGVDDEHAGQIVYDFYRTIHYKPIFKTSVKNAELIKVVYNTWISTKISYINTIMQICHKTGCDIDTISDALALATDRIISPKYMRGGLEDACQCHPRDQLALSWLSNKLQISHNFFDDLMIGREDRTEWLAKTIQQYVIDENIPVVILGITCKAESSITGGSSAVLLNNILKELNIETKIYDPYTSHGIENLLEPHIFFIGAQHKCWKQYPFPKGSIVIDVFRYLNLENNKNITYVPIGKHN